MQGGSMWAFCILEFALFVVHFVYCAIVHCSSKYNETPFAQCIL
jgi:hypothetical protein